MLGVLTTLVLEVLIRTSASVQAMSQMLPTLGLTPACLEERLCSSPQTDGCTGVAEAAELDAAIDAIKVRLLRLRAI